MPKIKIFTDTSSDIPDSIREKYDIGILRFMSVFGETAYESGTELTNKQFYEKLAASDVIPTTSQTPFQTMYDTLLSASREYDSVIYITISSKGSGQYNTACMVKNQILEDDNPNADIHIVDSMKYSLFLAAAAVKASELADSGADVDTIIKACQEDFESWEVLLLVDTLEYLEKGGRINKASAFIGSLLDIKPIVSIRDGLIESTHKLRGKKRLLEKLVDLMLESPDYDSEAKDVMIIHSDEDKAQQLADILREKAGIENIRMTGEFGPIVGTHIGPGAVGIIYRKKLV